MTSSTSELAPGAEPEEDAICASALLWAVAPAAVRHRLRQGGARRAVRAREGGWRAAEGAKWARAGWCGVRNIPMSAQPLARGAIRAS